MEPINAHRNVWMLELCAIWASNSNDGRGEWTEPWEHDMDYMDFYLETEYASEVEFMDEDGEMFLVDAGDRIVDYDEDYIMSLLRPLFPQLKGG